MFDRKSIPERFLQQYLEALAQAKATQNSGTRNWNLLRSFAELKFKMTGGAKCPMCRAHVRHVIPVTVEKNDGSIKKYDCLCMRCLEGERGDSRLVALQLGEARVEYLPAQDDDNKVELETEPAKKAEPA
jgi:hypothetical protein